MKILDLLYESTGDLFGIGGVGIRAYEIYKRLQERHDITLLCKKYPGARDGGREGLRHLFVGTESRSLTKTLLSYAYHAAQFVKERGHEFDIIVEEFSPAIPTFLHTRRETPLVLQVQGYTGRLYFRKYNPAYASVLYGLEWLRPRFYDNFVFMNSETIRRYALGEGKNIAIIPNGISAELLDAVPQDGDYILYLGRIDIYGKGLDILLAAYKEFYKTYPHIRLVIAGEGRDRESFSAELMALPQEVRRNVEMAGWVSGPEKIDIIRRALYVVFPSRHEVQPIAVLEALACGKAVIVSSIPEFGPVVYHGAGLSFSAGSGLSLARTMKDLMTHEGRREMGQRGREWVRDFTWDKTTLQYEEFLCKIVGRNP